MVRVPATRCVVLLKQAVIQPAGQNIAMAAAAGGPSQDL